MKRIVRLIGCCLLMAAALPALAQTETQAFYIYQHDGRMNGFFYDEVEKMTYSRIDTLGLEHDDYVSQEIVTADSTYRIMLSAIDSIGFVQPEVKYNPKLRIIDSENKYFDIQDPINWYVTAGVDHEENYIIFYCWEEVPADLMPKPGDVFADPALQYGWAKKVTSVEQQGREIIAHCKDIDDISDIFQQLIIVEEYGNDRQGNLVSRRVAGRPDLTVGQFPKKATQGKFEGDIFNFTLNGHIPFYNSENLTASIDVTINGGVNVRADWRLPLFGSKYIGITTKLSMGVGVGFTLDGKLAEVMKGGVGQFAQIPIPAACPLLVLDMGPDGFIRGQADLKFTVASPTVGGSIWQKWEIVDWWPDCHWGFGDPNDDGKTPDPTNVTKYQLELSGYVQTGLSFPLKVKSLPLIARFFDASLGGEWYVGPKVSGAMAIDLADFNDFMDKPENTAAYDLVKGTSVTLSLCDADYEISADVKSVFSERKKWTFAEGTLSLLKPYEVKMVPEFGECSDYLEERIIDGKKQLCHVLAFEPTGNVIQPMKVGVALFQEEYYYKDEFYYSNRKERAAPYYQAELLGEHERSTWAEYVIPYTDGGTLWYNGKMKVCPYVEFMGKLMAASPVYEFDEGAIIEVENDTIVVDYDGVTLQPVKITGTCDELKPKREDLYPNFPDWMKIEGEDGEFDVSVYQEKFGKNYDPADTVWIKSTFSDDYLNYKGTRTVGGAKGTTYAKNPFVFVFLPNTKEDPASASYELYGNPGVQTQHGWIYFTLPTEGVQHTYTRLPDGNGWHCVSTYEGGDESMNLEFDLVKGTKRDYYFVQNGSISYQNSTLQNGHTIVGTITGSFGGSEEYDHQMKLEGHAFKKYPGGRYIAANLTLTAKEDDNAPVTKTDSNGLLIQVFFADYFKQ